MKFCRECGFQLNDTDKFCAKCGTPTGVSPAAPAGYSQTAYQQMPQQNFASVYGVPQPGPNEALLVVTCNSVYSRGNVVIKSGSGQFYRTENGKTSAIKMPVGSVTIRYKIDRGPCLTLVAARSKEYTKTLIFHPGEIITLQVSIGSEVNQALFQSSTGLAII